MSRPITSARQFIIGSKTRPAQLKISIAITACVSFAITYTSKRHAINTEPSAHRELLETFPCRGRTKKEANPIKLSRLPTWSLPLHQHAPAQPRINFFADKVNLSLPVDLYIAKIACPAHFVPNSWLQDRSTAGRARYMLYRASVLYGRT